MKQQYWCNLPRLIQALKTYIHAKGMTLRLKEQNSWLSLPRPLPTPVCAETPDFGDVSVDWGSRGPERLTQEVTLDCPAGHRNNNNLTSTTISVTCTLDGWINLDSCVAGKLPSLQTVTLNVNHHSYLIKKYILFTKSSIFCHFHFS